MNGCELVQQVGSSPLFDGINLSMVAISYNGHVDVQRHQLPKQPVQAGVITGFLVEALEDIEKLGATLSGEEPTPYFPATKEPPASCRSALWSLKTSSAF